MCTRFTGCDGSCAAGSKPLFSERYGYQKFIRAFGWRIGALTP